MDMKIVERLAQSYSIRKRLSALAVMFTREDMPLYLNINSGSYTDGKKIVVGVPLEMTAKMIERNLIKSSEQMLSIFKGLTIHEAEHVRSSSFPLVRKFNQLVESDYRKHGISGAGRVIGQGILNGIEDGRIERRAINRFVGVRKHIQYMNLAFFKVVGEIQNDILRDYLLSIVTIATSNLYLVGWHETYKDTEIGKLLEECVPLIKKGVASETPEGCYDACLKIHEKSMPVLIKLIEKNLDKNSMQNPFAQDSDGEMNPSMDNADRKDAPGNSQRQYRNEKKQKPQKDQSSDGQDGSSPNSDQQDQDEQDSSSKSKSQAQKDKEEKQKEDKESSGKGAESSDKKEEEKESKDSSSQDDAKKGSDENSDDETGTPSEMSREELDDLIKEINEAIYDENKRNLDDSTKEDAQKEKKDAALKKQREKNRLKPEDLKKISSNHSATYQEFQSNEPLDGLSKQRSKDLEKTILRILRNKKTEELRYRRSGTIDKRSYTRFIMNKESDVFYKSEKNEIDDVAFYILIDHSGSMSGTNMGLALTSASVIQEAIQRHCPLRVLGFNSGGRTTRLYDYKDFDDKANGSLIKFYNNSGSANCDGYAIKVATGELSKRSEGTKILFVLSDGYPTVAYDRDPILDAKEAVHEAKKKGIVVIPIVFGVNDCDRNNFETIYEKNIVMCEPVDIEKHLSKLLEKIIKVI